MWLKLEDGIANVQIFLLLTFSGTTLDKTFFDLDDYHATQKSFEAIRKKFVSLYENI